VAARSINALTTTLVSRPSQSRIDKRLRISANAVPPTVPGPLEDLEPMAETAPHVAALSGAGRGGPTNRAAVSFDSRVATVSLDGYDCSAARLGSGLPSRLKQAHMFANRTREGVRAPVRATPMAGRRLSARDAGKNRGNIAERGSRAGRRADFEEAAGENGCPAAPPQVLLGFLAANPRCPVAFLVAAPRICAEVRRFPPLYSAAAAENQYI